MTNVLTRLAFVVSLLLLVPTIAMANTVIVTGQVKYANGVAAAGRYVQYVVSVSSPVCFVNQSVVTDNQGFYYDTVSCSGQITSVSFTTKDCDGSTISQSVQVSPSSIAEANFTLGCVPPAGSGTYSFVVKGKVVYSNQQPFPNKAINILVDTTDLSGCSQQVTVYTDSFGFYKHTFVCNNYIPNARVSLIGCSGNPINSFLNNNNTDTVDFSITLACNPAPCQAEFAWVADTLDKKIIYFNSSLSSIGPNHVIISREWSWGDGTVTSGNQASPTHMYQTEGNYNACLKITTSGGCISIKCLTIPVKTVCKAAFQYSANNLYAPATVNFTSVGLSQAGQGDTIIETRWDFGDGSPYTLQPAASHVYASTGAYNVCLYIKSSSGCADSVCKTVTIVNKPIPDCSPHFNTTTSGLRVNFNSQSSNVEQGDSIVARLWAFGDSSTMSGNDITPTHYYTKPGVYRVCLTTTTKDGCVKTFCKLVVVNATPQNCGAYFEYDKSGYKTVAFNSSLSYSNVPADMSLGDSAIVERVWKFGDGSSMYGNVVNPIKQYAQAGVYTVCLSIRTASGCSNHYCSTVNVQDTVVVNQNTAQIQFVKLYPNPATKQLTTAIYCSQNSVQADIAIYDIYGIKRWGGSKMLLQGNNMTTLPVNYLTTGTYVVKVSTTLGTDSRTFYKL